MENILKVLLISMLAACAMESAPADEVEHVSRNEVIEMIPLGEEHYVCDETLEQGLPGSCLSLKVQGMDDGERLNAKVVSKTLTKDMDPKFQALFEIAALEIGLPGDSWKSIEYFNSFAEPKNGLDYLGVYLYQYNVVVYSDALDNPNGYHNEYQKESKNAVLVHEVFHHYQYLLGYGGGHPEEIFGKTGSQTWSEYRNQTDSPIARMENVSYCLENSHVSRCTVEGLGLSAAQGAVYMSAISGN